MGSYGTWIRVWAGSARRVRLLGCRIAPGSSSGPQGPNTRVPARSPHSGRAALLRPSSTPGAPSRGPSRGTSNILIDNGMTAPIPPSCQHPKPRSTAATSSYANVAGGDTTTAMDTDAAASSPAAPAAPPDSMPSPAPTGPPSGTPAMPSVTPASSPTQSAGPADLAHSQYGVASQHQRQQPVSILVWNVHGLPKVRSAQYETCQYITIVMSLETQCPALFDRQLSGYTVFTIPATSLGRAGEGVLLAVRQQLPFSFSHWQTDQANSTIWLTLKPAESRQQPLTLGVCYITPESHRSMHLSRRSAQVRFESLAAHVAQLSSEGHVLLAGDFNARVGAAAQPWITDLSDDACAQLQHSDSTINSCTCVRRLPWSFALAGPLETPWLSPVSKHAATLQLSTWTMLW